MTTARQALITWINQRKTGGWTPAEDFTTTEAHNAHPNYTRDTIGRALFKLVREGKLTRRSNQDGAIVYRPTQYLQ